MICSEARLNANRQNAQRSTGPKSPKGKARSAQNALKHGLRAQGASLLPTEDADAYHAFVTSVTDSLHPATPLEHELAQRAADLLWRLRRVPDAEAATLAADIDRRRTAARQKYDRDLANHDDYCRRRPTAKNLPDPPTPPDTEPVSAAHSLATTFCAHGAQSTNPYLALQRYETTLDRALARTLKELRQLQKDRRDQPADQAHADDEAPLPNEPTPPPAAAEPPPAELPNEPNPPSVSSVTSVAEPQRPELPNEPTTPICVHPRSSAVPTSSTDLPNEPTAQSKIQNQKSKISLTPVSPANAPPVAPPANPSAESPAHQTAASKSR